MKTAFAARTRMILAVSLLACAAAAHAQSAEERTAMPAVCSERDVNCVLNVPLPASQIESAPSGAGVGGTRSETQSPNTKVLVPVPGSGGALIVVPPATGP